MLTYKVFAQFRRNPCNKNVLSQLPCMILECVDEASLPLGADLQPFSDSLSYAYILVLWEFTKQCKHHDTHLVKPIPIP